MPIRLLAVLSTVLVLLSACGTEDSNASQAGGTAPKCVYPESSRPAAKQVNTPPGDPTVTGTVEVTIATSAGYLTADLDATAAPCTVNSFLSLAEQGYYDDTSCHRLTTKGIFVLQCGDPTGTGSGSPGYTFADELTGDEQYGPGTLAMANAGPNTNGSQFFIVYQDSNAILGPDYTVFGQLDDVSATTVIEVAKHGTDTGEPDGAPKSPVDISGVMVG